MGSGSTIPAPSAGGPAEGGEHGFDFDGVGLALGLVRCGEGVGVGTWGRVWPTLGTTAGGGGEAGGRVMDEVSRSSSSSSPPADWEMPVLSTT